MSRHQLGHYGPGQPTFRINDNWDEENPNDACSILHRKDGLSAYICARNNVVQVITGPKEERERERLFITQTDDRESYTLSNDKEKKQEIIMLYKEYKELVIYLLDEAYPIEKST